MNIKGTSKLEKISSNYILFNIFDYIQDTFFKFKLFVHSKLYQKKCNITNDDYKDIYFSTLNLINKNFDNYLIFNTFKYTNNFNKNILKENFQKDYISKEYIILYYKKYLKDNLEKANDFEFTQYKHFLKPISIYSPFFNILSYTDIFEELFTIEIPIKNIQKFNLKNDYINAFNILNELNTEYSSISLKISNNDDINVFFDFNIDFTKIKSLIIKCEKDVLPNKKILFENTFEKIAK